jgi:hypothetical protein
MHTVGGFWKIGIAASRRRGQDQLTVMTALLDDLTKSMVLPFL